MFRICQIKFNEIKIYIRVSLKITLYLNDLVIIKSEDFIEVIKFKNKSNGSLVKCG